MPDSATYGTSDSLARRRRVAEALMMQGMSAEPVQHWTQGLARVTQALVGGYMGHRADKEEREREGKLVTGLTAGMGFAPPAATAGPPHAARPGADAADTDPTRAAIAKAATAAGQDPATLLSIAKMESDMGRVQSNPRSSARGLYHFLDENRRWSERAGVPYGDTPETQTAAMMAKMRSDAEIFKRKTGRDPQPWEHYVLHYQGGPLGTQLLAMDPKTPLPAALGTRAQAILTANPNLQKYATVGDFLADYRQRFEGNYSRYTQPQAAPDAAAAPAAGPAAAAAPAAGPATGGVGVQLTPQVAQYIQSLVANPQTRQYGIQLYSGLVSQAEKSRIDHASALTLQAEKAKLDQAAKVADRRQMMEALGPIFGGTDEGAPAPAQPQAGAAVAPPPGVIVDPPDRAAAAAPPAAGPAVDRRAQVMGDPNLRRMIMANLAMGDTKGALTALENAYKGALDEERKVAAEQRAPAIEGAKKEAEERAKAKAGDAKAAEAAQAIAGNLGLLDRAINAMGKSRLQAAASPSLDYEGWGASVYRGANTQSHNDRRILLSYVDNIILPAMDQLRGLGAASDRDVARLESAYGGMKTATTADDFIRHMDTIRSVISRKIPGGLGETGDFVPQWIRQAEEQQREERAKEARQRQPAPAAQPRADGRPPEAATARSVDSFGPEMEGKEVYDSQTKLWGKVVGGRFVSHREMIQQLGRQGLSATRRAE